MELRKRKRDYKNTSNKRSKKETVLIENLFNKKLKSNEKKAILIFGCPGSGKSNYINSNNSEFNNYVKISRDYFIENNLNGYNNSDKWKVLQRLILDVEKEGLTKNYNLLWEVTGRNWSDISRIRNICYENDYNLKFVFIKSDKDLCKNRIKFREKYNDRTVSLEKFNQVYDKILANFKRLKDENEKIHIYDNIWLPI
jgi:predicted kinase